MSRRFLNLNFRAQDVKIAPDLLTIFEFLRHKTSKLHLIHTFRNPKIESKNSKMR